MTHYLSYLFITFYIYIKESDNGIDMDEEKLI